VDLVSTDRPTVRRTRLLLVAAVWAVAVAVTLAVAAQTKIGPDFTVVEGHGLHLGDLVAAAVSGAFALAVTVAVRHRQR
jgi:hypothetical protein